MVIGLGVVVVGRGRRRGDDCGDLGEWLWLDLEWRGEILLLLLVVVVVVVVVLRRVRLGGWRWRV